MPSKPAIMMLLQTFLPRPIVDFIFIENVKKHGAWDLKERDDWKAYNGKQLMYRGIPIDNDDVGNIHFGFVGAALYLIRY